MSVTTTTKSKITGVDIFGPATRDAKRLVAFYRDVLGMTPTQSDDTGAEFELSDGTTFGLCQPEEGSVPTAAGYTALFAVDDINAAVEQFRANGAQLAPPFETPVCYMSFGHDPDGNFFGIHQRKK